MNDVS